jgi:hypothetical protein
MLAFTEAGKTKLNGLTVSVHLSADGDHDGAVTWRRITDAVGQLANTTPPGPVH